MFPFIYFPNLPHREYIRSAQVPAAFPLSADDGNPPQEKMLRPLSAKSGTAGAIRHALSRWRALNRCLDDGWLEIDISAAERALRAVAIGRKNLLFTGSDPGGQITSLRESGHKFRRFLCREEAAVHRKDPGSSMT